MAKKSKSYYEHLPNKPGKKIRGRGKVLRIRAKKIAPHKVIHLRIMSKKGPRGGRTIAGGVIKTKSR